jgi:GNAT superfamily N-acetyltransferase
MPTFPSDDIELEMRSIKPGDKLTGLSLGAEFTALKIFLQKHAAAYHDKSLARTYGIFERMVDGRERIVAYITLVCGEIVIAGGDDPLVSGDPDLDYRDSHYPAVKIARLAVDARYRKHRLGSQLVEFALGIAKGTICPAVGCRFVVVDSKTTALKFYERCGFTVLDTEANRQRSEPVAFVDLHKLQISN